MPDYAPNFTARIRIRYLAGGRIHTQQWRCSAVGVGGATIAVAMGQIQAVYDAIGPGMAPDWAILGASAADTNEDVFLPVTPPTATGGASAPAAGTEKRFSAQHISFTGRSASGLRAVVFFYGFKGIMLAETADTESEDFRIYATENTVIADTIAALNTSPALVANDIEVVSWNAYANVKYNDYWLRRNRQGS